MDSMDTDQSSCTFNLSLPDRPNPLGKDVTLVPSSAIASNSDDEPIEFPPQMESIEPVYVKLPSTRTSSPAPLVLGSRFSEMEITSTRYMTRSVTRQYEMLQMNPIPAKRSLKPVPTSEVRDIFYRRPKVPPKPDQLAKPSTYTIKHFVHSTPKIPKSRLVSNIVTRAERENRTPSPKMGVTGLKRLPFGPRMTRSKTRLLKMTPAEVVQERRSREAAQSLSMFTFPSTPKAESRKPAKQFCKPATQSSKPATQSSKPATQSSKPATQSSKPATPKVKKIQKEERLSRPRNRALIFNDRPYARQVVQCHGRSASPKTRLPVPVSYSPHPGFSSDYKHSPLRESAGAMILSSTRLSSAARSKTPAPTKQQKVTRTSSFVKKVRSLATSIKKTFTRKSKTKQPQKTIDVSTFSRVQQASDVQWVELNSTRSTNQAGVVQSQVSIPSRFVGDTDKTFDTSLPVTCFGRGKVAFNKKSEKSHTKKMMKARKSTPFKNDRIMINPSTSLIKIATPVKPRHLKEPAQVIPVQAVPVQEPVIPPVSFYKALRPAASPILTKPDSTPPQQVSAVSTEESKQQSQQSNMTVKSAATPASLPSGNTGQSGTGFILTMTPAQSSAVKLQRSAENESKAVGKMVTVTHSAEIFAVPSISTAKTGDVCKKSSKNVPPSSKSSQSDSISSTPSSSTTTAVKPLHTMQTFQPSQSSVATYHRLVGPIPFPPPSQQVIQSQTTYPVMQTNLINIQQDAMRRVNQYPHHIASTQPSWNPWMANRNPMYHTGVVPVFQTNQQPMVTTWMTQPPMSRQLSLPALHLSGHQYDPSHIQAIHHQQLQHMQTQQYNMMCIQNSNVLYMANNQNNAYMSRRPINYHSRDPVMTQTCLEPIQPKEPVHPMTSAQLPRNHPARRPTSLNLKNAVTDYNCNMMSIQPKACSLGPQKLDVPVLSSPIVPEEESPKRSSCMYAPRTSQPMSVQTLPLHAEVQRNAEQQQELSSVNLLSAAQQYVTDHIPAILPSQSVKSTDVNAEQQTVENSCVMKIQASLENLTELSLPSSTSCVVVNQSTPMENISGTSEINNNVAAHDPKMSSAESSNLTIPDHCYALPERNITHQQSSTEAKERSTETDILVNKQTVSEVSSDLPTQSSVCDQDIQSALSSAMPGQQENFEMTTEAQGIVVPSQQPTESTTEGSILLAAPSAVPSSTYESLLAQSESNMVVSSHTAEANISSQSSMSISLDSTTSLISDSLKLDFSQPTSFENISTLSMTDLSGMNLTLFDELSDVPSNPGSASMDDDKSSPSSTASIRTLHTPVVKVHNTAETQTRLSIGSSETLDLFNTTKSGKDRELLAADVLSLPMDCNKNSVVKELPDSTLSVQETDNVTTVLPVIKEWSRVNSFQSDSSTQLVVPKIPSRNKMLPLGMSSVFPSSVRHDDAPEPMDDDNDDDDVFSTTSSDDMFPSYNSYSSHGSAFKSRKRLFAEVESSKTIPASCNDMSSPFTSRRSPSASPETKRGKCEPDVVAEESLSLVESLSDVSSRTQEELEANNTTLKHLRSGVESAFTENCSSCELASRLMMIKPFHLLGLTSTSQVILALMRDHNTFSIDTDVASYLDIPDKVISMALFKAREKPHIFARNLIFLLFSIGELYQNRACTLDPKRMTAVQQCVQMRFGIDNKSYFRTCVTFINQHMRHLFQKKLRTQIYRPILEHVCKPSA